MFKDLQEGLEYWGSHTFSMRPSMTVDEGVEAISWGVQALHRLPSSLYEAVKIMEFHSTLDTLSLYAWAETRRQP